ncbi:MAG: tRNA-(ms[2]io[6]A)-hydroxylase [Gammaproteobacteria bacterium]|nr:tRNA-(ms[2]io[6]A)-hydroxylase [Gammaproteobacteria bacterium]
MTDEQLLAEPGSANTPAPQASRTVCTADLRYQTGSAWIEAVLGDFNGFMQDHAAAEKKAAGMAMSMISHYPDKPELVEAMSELAVEEMSHFRDVAKWLHRRGTTLAADRKDPYILRVRDVIRLGRDVYFLDRLLTAGIIEARGAERFGLVADALPAGSLKNFYRGIARSEQRHLDLFESLARRYFSNTLVNARIDELLDIEAGIAADIPTRAALH